MHVFHDKSAARAWVRQQTQQGLSVGLVPTMGALHEGHFSLVQSSVKKCSATIATIFVNPTQFGPGEDLDRYPRTLEFDLEGLRQHGADAVFVPDATAMYGAQHSTYVDPPQVATSLEGELRPVHFRGVTTVVLKLLHILPGTHAFFGQKDFQQAAVIKAMVRDLDLDIDVVVCPIVRDADGLALSSRNRYLSFLERQKGLGLSRALRVAAEMVAEGEEQTAVIENQMHSVLTSAAVDAVDYAIVVDPDTLQPVDRVDRPAVALLAARVGSTRLIDNAILKPRSTASTDSE